MAKETLKKETYARNILLMAEAEAEANRKLAASLIPQLVELKKLEKWDGRLSQVAGSGAALISIKEQ